MDQRMIGQTLGQYRIAGQLGAWRRGRSSCAIGTMEGILRRF
jgi:hypothetical protein